MTGADFLSLDPGAAPARGRTAWLAQRLRTAIADGTLAPGTRLPASRALAADLSVGRGTVVEAYRRIAEEGLLVTNRGGGTTIAELATAVPANLRSAPAVEASSELLNISSGVPDVSAFPRAPWLRAERRVLATATERELGYADPRGAPQLRTALAGWLARSRGLTVQPERIIITAGVTGALSLVAQVLRERGSAEWAIEDPGAVGNRRILDYWLDALHPVPVDEEGLCVDALPRTDVRAVLVTPAHQFPTGVVLSPQRRRQLIAWAQETGGLVIEDDYDSEYRYDRAPVRAMHAAAPERIVHISSLSKVLAPGMRIGWMIAPSWLHDDLVRKRWASDLGSPTLPQLVFAELIETGALERHLRGLRLRHRARRDAAAAAIRRYLPGCRSEGIAAGLHLLVRLPEHIDDAELAARAEAEGIAVQPLSAHRFAPGPPGLVIGYGPHPAARLAAAIKILGALAGLSPVIGE
ncbi:GntR family transcriptional regulator/MocR family aminotransferase [Tamaricihabitans halophyticus]|uniref:GntR family transcriptional regulator/MocR family aminotransferase n=1 Tax=Tamaricihabitans halophyticus TaxID=1262583 RepID=A0A4R2Q5F6_9PSEU|nr:PLP-dependent aminotransferase family protein [Tamaricihabitans halophyticus]TCP43857.1 GntR family transcriptional regulator/MocR family aminotransferase [Tamaricihabitans halophyticus]